MKVIVKKCNGWYCMVSCWLLFFGGVLGGACALFFRLRIVFENLNHHYFLARMTEKIIAFSIFGSSEVQVLNFDP